MLNNNRKVGIAQVTANDGLVGYHLCVYHMVPASLTCRALPVPAILNFKNKLLCSESDTLLSNL